MRNFWCRHDRIIVRGHTPQAVTDLRSDKWQLDPVRAQHLASQYLTDAGITGSVAVDAAGVHVSVSGNVTPVLLGWFGVGSRTISVARTALPVDH